MLQTPQTLHGGGIPGVTAQMESPDALDGGDASLHQGPPDKGNGVAPPFAPPRQIDFGAAIIAADGLGVVTAAGGVVVLGTARPAHGEDPHAGPFPVVGHGVQNGQPGAAGGAIDEGMQITAVRGVEKLLPALGADADIGRNEDVPRLVEAFDDGKSVILFFLVDAHIGLEDHGTGRRVGGKTVQELGQLFFRTPGADLHERPLVGHTAGNAAELRDPGHEGAEPHPLHDAVEPDDPGNFFALLRHDHSCCS